MNSGCACVPLGAVTGMTCTLVGGGVEAAVLYILQHRTNCMFLALISRVAVFPSLTSRSGKFLAKENLVDTDEADNTNVYPVFIFIGDTETFQFLAVLLLKICDSASLD